MPGQKDQIIQLPFNVPIRLSKTGMASSDFIVDIINLDIKAFRMQSFDNYSIDVRAYPTSTAYLFHDANGRWVGFSEYHFESFGSQSKAMEVALTLNNEVRVWHAGKFKRIEEVLRHFKPYNPWEGFSSPADVIHQKWRQQADWWRDNGKVFPLMELPSEIREIIYTHVWGNFIEPFPLGKTRKLTSAGKIAAKLRKPNARLLETNGQVAEEASNVLFLRSQFFVEHYGILHRVTDNINMRSRIRQLTLALPHDQFMKLFSTEHVRKEKETKATIVGFGSPALSIQSMCLNRLRLVFAAPSYVTCSEKFDGACQRVAVDMIMDAAWPVIRGHPVSIHGFVKDSQKNLYKAREALERQRVQAWRKRREAYGLPEGSLKEYNEEIDEEVGGVRLDGSMLEVDPDLGPPIEYDLTCRCDPPCREETWTSAD